MERLKGGEVDRWRDVKWRDSKQDEWLAELEVFQPDRE